MVVDLPRSWRWTICVAGAALLLLWIGMVGSTRPDAAAAAGEVPSRPASAAFIGADRPEPPTAVREVGARGVDQIQVCGGAWVQLQADGGLNLEDLERASRLASGREQILAAMRAGPSDLSRAAALLLTPGDPAAIIDALARTALASADARLYALAFKACGTGDGRSEGACRMLSAAQWARIDPGNAAPWQFIYAEAASSGDRSAQDEALFQMANARRHASGFFDLVGAVLDAMPDDDASQLAGWSLATQAVGLQAATTLPGMQSMLHGCKGGALLDANRAQSCAGIAETMAERSDSLLDRMMGAAIGRQIGWPDDRLDRIRGEYRAYMSQVGGLPGINNEFGCAGIRRGLALVRRHASLGEVGAMHEWIRESGKRPKNFVAESRASPQGSDAPAAAAASASNVSGGVR